jgi:hypothetical protein
VLKGRCSNDPALCEFAAQGTELPYAGLDSVCPACQSPLAAVRSDDNHQGEPDVISEGGLGNIPVETIPFASTDTPIEAIDELDDPQGTQVKPSAPSASIIQFTRLVAIAAGLAFLGFIGLRILAPSTSSQGDSAQESQDPSLKDSGLTALTDGLDLTQISPPAVRQVSQATQAYVSPDLTSAVIIPLAKDVVLDVTGRMDVNGVGWARITLPIDRSRSGFVLETSLVNLGDGEGDYSSLDPLAGNTINAATGPVMPVQIGSSKLTQAMTYQIVGPAAVIRLQAAPSSPQIGMVLAGVVVAVIGQQNNATGDWFQVALTDGRTGWISSVSLVPVALPSGAEVPTEPAPMTSAPVLQAAPGSSSTSPAPVIPPPSQPSVTAPTKIEPAVEPNG